MTAALDVRILAKRKTPSLAKISRPHYTGILPRKRLFTLLDRGREYPVLWVTGPPGSGKTTLVASYIDAHNAHKLPCLWYQMDERDGDIATLFYYLGIAAKKAAPRYRKPLPLLTPEYLLGINTFTQRYFEDLYSRLIPRKASRVTRKEFIIVFDNYHKVPSDSGFHEMLIHGLDIIPEGINVVIISRHEPPPQFARLQANEKICHIGWDEIRFTIDEFKEIVRRKVQRKLADEILLALYEKTDGWIAGLVLGLESAKAGNLEPQLLTELSRKSIIFDYFAGEIFNKTEKEIQNFLLKTAFLPRMTADMAERLTGLQQAEEILNDFNQRNYFTIRYGRPISFYQYHPLFREFLLSHGRNIFTKEEIAQAQRSAALILEESGQMEDAAKLFLDSSGWDGLSRLLNKNSQFLLSQGRHQVMREWLSSLPEDILGDSPWLLYWMGLSCLPFEPCLSRSYFEKAFKKFRALSEPTGIFLSWSGAVDTFVNESKDLTGLDRWIELIEKILKETPSFPSDEIEARVSSLLSIALLVRKPGDPQITKLAEKALSLSQKIKDLNLYLQSGFHLSVYYLWMGDFTKAAILINSLREVAKSKETPLGIQLLRTSEAMYELLTVSPATGLKRAFEGLELANESGVHLWDFHLIEHGIASALGMGDLIKARELLQRMEAGLSKARRFDICYYHFLSGWYALLSKDLSSARQHIERSLDLSVAVGISFPEAVCRILMAQILHEFGEDKEAEEQLSRASKIGNLMKSKLVMFMALLTETYMSFTREKLKHGLESLRRALAIGRENGLANFFGWRPSMMTCLCLRALDSGIEVEYVQNLIKRRNLIPDSPPFECERWPWQLKIFTLGRFGLVKDERPVRFLRKAQKRPIDLLKVLISLRGRNVTEDQITDFLWPEADGDTAYRAFITNLQRLRKLIGPEKLVLQEGMLTLDPRYCWVDVWAFERIIGQAEATIKKNGYTEDATKLIEKAIALYHGDFLPEDSDKPWTVGLRERLKIKVLRNICDLGCYLEDKGEFKKAIHIFERGLEINILGEEFSQHLMTYYRDLGHRAEAIEAYQRLKKCLSAFGIEPSKETEAIYKSLLSE